MAGAFPPGAIIIRAPNSWMPPCHDSRVGSKLRSLKIFNRAQRHQVAWRCCVLPLCERWLTTRILLLKEEAQDNSGVASNYCLMCLRLRSRVCADAPACSCVCVCSCGPGPRVDRSNVQRWRANLQKSVKECARICKRVQTSARESAKECKRVRANLQKSAKECARIRKRVQKSAREFAKECKRVRASSRRTLNICEPNITQPFRESAETCKLLPDVT